MRVSPLHLWHIPQIPDMASPSLAEKAVNAFVIRRLQLWRIGGHWHGSCINPRCRQVLDWPSRTSRLEMSVGTVERWGRIFGCVVLLTLAQVASAQLQLGDNTKMNAGGLFSVGYAGDYGNQIPSSHGLQFGASGTLDGYYYNPNFINFSVTPYYNQSKDDSSYQSLTNASGVAATANFFTGSHFPGSVSYRYDYNSTGTFGLPTHRTSPPRGMAKASE